VYKLDLGAASTGVAVRTGPAPRRGGGGSGTGGGAPANSSGTGAQPVPVALLQTLPQPIGDTDFIKASDYPEEARRLGIEGAVKVRLVIDERGQVIARSLAGPRLGHGLDELALRKARLLRFKPGLDRDGRPVTTSIVWTFRCVLPE
jgi:protein TonB